MCSTWQPLLARVPEEFLGAVVDAHGRHSRHDGSRRPFVDGKHDHPPPGGDEPCESGNSALRVRNVLGHHAQGDEIELLIGGKILEQALVALMDEGIGLDVVARVDPNEECAALGKLACALGVPRKGGAAGANVEPPCIRGDEAEDEGFVEIGWDRISVLRA